MYKWASFECTWIFLFLCHRCSWLGRLWKRGRSCGAVALQNRFPLDFNLSIYSCTALCLVNTGPHQCRSQRCSADASGDTVWQSWEEPRTEWSCSAVTWMLIRKIPHSQASATHFFAALRWRREGGGFSVTQYHMTWVWRLKGIGHLGIASPDGNVSQSPWSSEILWILRNVDLRLSERQ